jgi:ferredoxin-NADP reductase/MOSC domain-containing protein YiiM
VPEPWLISAEGAVGDERAVHPDKIYLFARSAYDYWGEQLGIDPDSWPDGFFGENLTVDELDETATHIGDVFAVGDEVRLEVVGARTPCLKLAWRLQQPRTFQRTFALSRHTGAYLGVLAAGTVRPGDVVRRIHHDSTMPTIADVCGFVERPQPPPLASLRRLLNFERLSFTTRMMLRTKLDAAERADSASGVRWRGWRKFAIRGIADEVPGVRSFELRPLDGEALCQPLPGQFVTVRMPCADGSMITRTWSLSAFSHGMDAYRVTVQRQSGPGSRWLHEAEQGAELMLRAPAGDFVLDTGSFRPVVLIAAGIGITPLMAMLQAHLLRPPVAGIHLVYCERTPAEVTFRGELDAIAATHPDVRITYLYTRSDAGEHPRGRISAEALIGLLSDLHVVFDGHRVVLPWHESLMYLCGPGDFCRELKDSLVARGANANQLRTELFSAAPEDLSWIKTASVHLQSSGVTLSWNSEDDLTLLELAAAAGVELPHECRAGACLSCKTRLLEGATTADVGDGSSLVCIGRPKTSRIVLEC